MQLVAFTPDGRTAITGDVDGGVTSWDVRQAEAVETLAGHRREASSFAVTSDGHTLYSASLDRSVFAWDLAGARRLGRPFSAGSGSAANYPRYAMSADGRLIAFGQNNGSVSIVDARTLAGRRELPVGDAGPRHGLRSRQPPARRQRLERLPGAGRRRLGPRAVARSRTRRPDQHAGHQRRRPAARHRRPPTAPCASGRCPTGARSDRR